MKTKTKDATIVPAGDRLLVRYDKPERETPGGILLPDVVREAAIHGTVQATVVAVGPGRPLDGGGFAPTIDAGVGDRLLLDSVHDAWWVEDPKTPGSKLHMIRGIDVLAVLR